MATMAIPVILGTAMSAVGTLSSAGQRSASAQFESQQYEQQAQAARTASMQEEASRRRDLTSSLEAIAAIRAGRGVGAASPTADAIYGSMIDRSEDDIQASKTNYAAKADLSARAAMLSQRRASTSLLAGFLSAGSDVFNSAVRIDRAYTGR